MKNNLLYLAAFAAMFTANAQTESDLSTVTNLLTTPKVINVTTNGYDFFKKADFNPAGDYTIEVKAKVNSSASRGMDVEAVNAAGQGFRVSSSPTAIVDFANIFSAGSYIAANDNTTLTTLRYVMYNNALNIYKNNAATPINAAAIAKTSVSKNLILDGGFENGGWSNWISTGSSIGTVTLKEVSEVLQYDATLATGTSVPNSGKALFFDITTGTNGQGWYYTAPVTAGTYELKVKSLPYKLGASTSAIQNTLIRVRAGVGVSGTSITNAYLNGHSGNGSWVNTTLRFEVPAGETNVSISIEKSNNNKIYFDDFELNRIGDNLPILSVDNNSTNNTGIFDNQNLLKATTSFEGLVQDASPGGLWEANKAMGGALSARIYTNTTLTTNLKDGSNTFLMRFEQGYTWFAYPVSLQPNKVYKLSYLQAGNSASMPSYIVAVCNAKEGSTATTYYLKSTTTPSATALAGTIVTQYFSTPATLPAEQVYLSFYKNSTNAPIFHVDKLVLLEATGEEIHGLVVGKNFYNGAADMEIESVKVTDSAYIPVSTTTGFKNSTLQTTVSFYNSVLTIKNCNATNLSIYSANGVRVKNLAIKNKAEQNFNIALPNGIYLLKTGNETQKLMVK